MYWIERHWYRRTPVSIVLLPFAAFYWFAATLRRALYRLRFLRAQALPVPVIVIGNITVGGTGKTPLVAWLARWLSNQGYRPGIVMRGYRGRAASWPQAVHPGADPMLVGDEPVLLARAAGCPVMAGPDRVRAGSRLIAEHGCDVVLSDDGLQHYRLARDIEIAVIDGERRFGNGFYLPAGPLRESVSRLRFVDLRVANGTPQADEIGMRFEEEGFCRLGERQASAGAERFHGRRVHAVAAIGNPRRFFDHLRCLGIDTIEHAFADHHAFTPADLAFGDGLDIIMTEKDAVKCERLGISGWYMKVAARPDPRLGEFVLQWLKEKSRG
ncbi:MAG TPA: tetraacyldisaccharide 4'-kinase [Burkholderiales bacterium]|nr:tetraacyldisaccharide 4'-kinase [Burkholderiales bacterium]